MSGNVRRRRTRKKYYQGGHLGQQRRSDGNNAAAAGSRAPQGVRSSQCALFGVLGTSGGMWLSTLTSRTRLRAAGSRLDQRQWRSGTREGEINDTRIVLLLPSLRCAELR